MSDHRHTSQPSPIDGRSIGQSLVEFALVLPLLLVLLCGAIDFGRVFFSWVQLTNVARVGANYAAEHPSAWGAPGSAGERIAYAAVMANEAAGINCALTPAAPAPSFPEGTAIGDPAIVATACQFDLITPIMSSFFGSDYTIRANATFPIRTGCSGCPPAPTPTPLPTASPTPTPEPCGIVPDLRTLTVAAARSAWTGNRFTGSFAPATAVNTHVVVTQETDPPSNPGDCITLAARVTVTTEPPAAPPSCGVVPDMFGMTVASARTSWTSAGFTGGFTPSGNNSNTVLGQTTNPATNPGDCVPFTTTVTVTHGSAPTPVPTPTPAPCIVPSFIGTSSTNADSTWSSAGFTGQLRYEQQNRRPYTIQSQTLVGGSPVPCTSQIRVGP